MKYLIPLSFLLFACTTTTYKCNGPCPPGLTAKPEIKVPEGSVPVKAFVYGKEKSDELYRHLKEIGVSSVREGSSTYLTAHDLTCQLVPTTSGAETTCEYWDGAPGSKNRKHHLAKNKKGLEELRMFLSEYPVEQGDTGAVARFAQCRIYKDSMDCFLAIHLNYEGP